MNEPNNEPDTSSKKLQKTKKVKTLELYPEAGYSKSEIEHIIYKPVQIIQVEEITVSKPKTISKKRLTRKPQKFVRHTRSTDRQATLGNVIYSTSLTKVVENDDHSIVIQKESANCLNSIQQMVEVNEEEPPFNTKVADNDDDDPLNITNQSSIPTKVEVNEEHSLSITKLVENNDDKIIPVNTIINNESSFTQEDSTEVIYLTRQKLKIITKFVENNDDSLNTIITNDSQEKSAKVIYSTSQKVKVDNNDEVIPVNTINESTKKIIKKTAETYKPSDFDDSFSEGDDHHNDYTYPNIHKKPCTVQKNVKNRCRKRKNTKKKPTLNQKEVNIKSIDDNPKEMATEMETKEVPKNLEVGEKPKLISKGKPSIEEIRKSVEQTSCLEKVISTETSTEHYNSMSPTVSLERLDLSDILKKENIGKEKEITEEEVFNQLFESPPSTVEMSPKSIEEFLSRFDEPVELTRSKEELLQALLNETVDYIVKLNQTFEDEF